MNDNLDLSKLAQPPAPAGVSYVRDVDESNFEAVVGLSLQHPVVLELTLPSAAETHAVDEALIEVTNQAEGRWLLARVDVGRTPAIAQALRVQAVPTVLVVIGGQARPLFQGTRDKAEIKAALDQVAQVALANGVTGRAQPVPGGATVSAAAADSLGDEPPIDPRFAPADAALEKGDLAGAVIEFDKLLAANPRDAEAAAGKAQVSLVLRAAELDPDTVLADADAAPDDIDAQLAAADADMVAGRSQAAFARLIATIRATSDKTRERVRVRLVELFSTLPPQDPALAQARRDLTTALF